MTIELRTLSVDDWREWRTVRLAALTDAPSAFGSRLQEWADAPDDRWRDRLSIPGAIDLLAVNIDGNVPVGMATGTPSADPASRAELISMWVDPRRSQSWCRHCAHYGHRALGGDYWRSDARPLRDAGQSSSPTNLRKKRLCPLRRTRRSVARWPARARHAARPQPRARRNRLAPCSRTKPHH